MRVRVQLKHLRLSRPAGKLLSCLTCVHSCITGLHQSIFRLNAFWDCRASNKCELQPHLVSLRVPTQIDQQL